MHTDFANMNGIIAWKSRAKTQTFQKLDRNKADKLPLSQ
jgi:hypothetical protein